MFRAAATVGVATRPLQVFYGLSQAGRAIAAAASGLTGDEWELAGHGIRCDSLTLRGPLADIRLEAGKAGGRRSRRPLPWRGPAGTRRAPLAGLADQDGPIGLRPVRAKQSSSPLSVLLPAAASSPPYGRRCAMASPALTRRHSHGSWRLRGRGQALGVQAEAAAVGRVIMSQRTVISRAGREGRRVLPG